MWSGDQPGRDGAQGHTGHVPLCCPQGRCQLCGQHVSTSAKSPRTGGCRGSETGDPIRSAFSWVLTVAFWLVSLSGISVQPHPPTRKGASKPLILKPHCVRSSCIYDLDLFLNLLTSNSHGLFHQHIFRRPHWVSVPCLHCSPAPASLTSFSCAQPIEALLLTAWISFLFKPSW